MDSKGSGIAVMENSTLRVDSEPFEQIPHWILFNTELSSNAIRIWLVLRKHRGYETGQCWPGRGRIAAMCGVSLSTVKRELANLARFGAITVTARKTENGDSDTNLYTVHWLPFGVIHRGRSTENPPRFRKPLGGGFTENHELIPIDNKEGVLPDWLAQMDDGPEFTAAYLAYAKGQLQ